MADEFKPYELLEELIDDVLQKLEQGGSAAKEKLDQFVTAFEEEYPIDDTEPEADYDRDGAEAVAWVLFDVPLLLYAIGANGAAIVELHGILEGLSLRYAVHEFADPPKHLLLGDVFERFTLRNLAEQLKDLELLDADDVKFANRLSTFRNGVAHKNPKIVSKAFASGQQISFFDIDMVMEKVDCVPIFIQAIRYVLNLNRSGSQGDG